MSQTSAGPYEPCPCGSEAKYKFCCRDKDHQAKDTGSEASGGTAFSRENFMKFANELGLAKHLGPQGAEEVYRLASAMENNRRTRKTRPLPQMETQVDPRLPAAAIDLSSAYPKPSPVRTRAAMFLQGNLITKEWIGRIKEDPGWENGERPQELIRKTFLALLDGWERHLSGSLRFPRKEVSDWRPLLEEFLFGP